MLRVVLSVLSVALTIFALADCIQAPEEKVRGIPRWAWIVLVVLVPWVGPITWLVVSRLGGTPEERRSAQQSRRPLAPDEDPEFLRRLDEDIRRERRQREQERREREQRQQQEGTDERREQDQGPDHSPE